MKDITIGRLAKMAGVSIDTVRYYERRELLAPPPRTAANYRVYPAEDASRLRFIKKAKALGFSLGEIKELLSLRHDPDATKGDMKRQAEAKIGTIRQRISDLTRMLTVLEHLAESCDGEGPISECPILKALEEDA